MKYNNPKGELAVLGIDLAKQSFQLHGVDARVNIVLKKKLSRKKLSEFIVQSPTLLADPNTASLRETPLIYSFTSFRSRLCQ